VFDGVCFSGMEYDECDVCDGDGSSCGLTGDLNGDGMVNVLDVVVLVNIVLGGSEPIDAGDLNGDGIINASDRYLKGSPQADFTFGFQSNMNYKNFDLAFNLRASLGNYVYNNVNSSGAQYALLQDNAVLGNIPTSVLNTNFLNTSDVII
jgi:hypothetical protein